MNNFLKKHFTLITILLIVALAVSAWKLPSIAPVIGIAFLCFTLGIAISSTVAKHRAAYREGKLTRFAFARNVCLDVFGILLAMVLAALLARYVAELVAKQIDGALLRFVIGMLVGILIGVGVGILVRQTWARFVKTSPN